MLLPADGIVKETATGIVRGAASDLEKARAIYEWIVDNTFRDPKTRDCGTGDIRFMLESGDLGYKSLGTSSEVVTKAQHCRAEVYISGYGWVPVDPADVRKVVLEEPPGNRPPDDRIVTKARARLFGSWEMNWMAYNYAHDVALPGSAGAPVGFLMYPQAETPAGRVDSLDPDRFKYGIVSTQVEPAV